MKLLGWRSFRRAGSQGVVVREAGDRGRGVFAARSFAEGERVVQGRPVGWVDARTRHSLQMGPETHALFDEPACLINHSCAPNTGVRNNALGGYDFLAIRPIAEGEEISFDYATTEHVSIAVPSCLCGAAACRGRSGGFVELPKDHPLIASGHIAAYLKDLPS